MKKSLLVFLLMAAMILPGSVYAGEYNSVYVWYAGKNSTGAPPNAIKSERYYFNFKQGQFINTVTVRGYGPYVKRLNIVFKDKKGNIGTHLVNFANAKKDAKGFYTYTYTVQNKDRWSLVWLEYKTLNFSLKNRVYTEPSLFWIDKADNVQLEPPTSEDDLM